jgi:hypothetical protein
MYKLMIRATKELGTRLEEKLRHRYDVQLEALDADNNGNGIVCEIKAKIKKETGLQSAGLHLTRI